MIFNHFSKRTLALILVLMAITAGLLYLALREERPSQPKITPTPKISHAFSTLSLIPEVASGSSVKIVDVHVESNTNMLSGAQINLSYDPTALTGVTLHLGDYFQHPNILLNTVDSKNGLVTLVIAIQPGAPQASGSGTIATLSYTLLPTAKAPIAIHFLPKTTLTQEGILETVLKSTEDFSVPLSITPTKIPVMTPLIPQDKLPTSK